MTSDARPKAGFVHVWLPGEPEPIVCGRLIDEDDQVAFTYARSYLGHPRCMALDPLRLPLQRGVQRPRVGGLHGVLRDASPDAWGRGVILQARTTGGATELGFLLAAGPDRIGALAVSSDRDVAEPSGTRPVELADLMQAAALIEAEQALPDALATALLHGTSVGGARPKALLTEPEGDKFVAKFSSTADTYPIVRCEAATMRLAIACGLETAPTRLVESVGKDVLLVQRFDRARSAGRWTRRFMVSGLTALQLHETEARLASYLDLAGFLRRSGSAPERDLPELFRRMVFNILIGNTDDHARNHAVFWDGTGHELTPAYDVAPVLRAGRTAAQAMVVGRSGRASTLSNARSEAGQFGLSPHAAMEIIEALVDGVREGWPLAAEEVGLSGRWRERLQTETILGPGCFE